MAEYLKTKNFKKTNDFLKYFQLKVNCNKFYSNKYLYAITYKGNILERIK